MSSYSTRFSWQQLWSCYLQPCRLAWNSQAVLAFMWMWVKTFRRHLHDVFNSPSRLGNYYFCPNIKSSCPLDSLTAEAGAGGKSRHITDWGLRILQACCFLWTSLVPGCCSLSSCHLCLCHWHIVGKRGSGNPGYHGQSFQCRSWPVWFLLHQIKGKLLMQPFLN